MFRILGTSRFAGMLACLVYCRTASAQDSPPSQPVADAQVLAGDIKVLLEKKAVLQKDIDAATNKLTDLSKKLDEATKEAEVSSKEKERLLLEIEGVKKQWSEQQDELKKLHAEKDALDREKAEREKIEKNTFLSCNGERVGPSSLFRMSRVCQWEVHWVTSSRDGDAVYKPARLYIVPTNDNDPIFEKTLSDRPPSSLRIIPGAWYKPEKFPVGKDFEAYIEYVLADKDRDPLPILVAKFRVDRSLVVGQFTGKVYTAWRRGADDENDQAFIVPGIAAGAAVRLGDRSDDTNIVGLRAILAVGPNLVSKARIVEEPDGSQTIQSKQSLQVLTGFEAVASKYLSLGLAWVVLGSEAGKTPLILLTYGELYPAASTK